MWEAIREEQTIPKRICCAALEVSEQGYYAHCRRLATPSARAQQDAEIGNAIVEEHRISRATYGTPRLKTALAQRGVRTSRRRIGRLCKVHGLQVKTRRRFVRTTDSDHKSPVAQNLLNRQFVAEAPNQVWMSDITYLQSADHWLYLCTITDGYSNRIVGRTCSRAIDADLVCDALAMALRNRGPVPGCVFHSDRGSQYASRKFVQMLEQHGLCQSMSRRANCWDNAVAESSFARLKTELGDQFASDAEAVRAVYEYCDVFHNHIRIHSRINQSPAAYEAAN